MKTIYENADYQTATEQLTQLCEAHAAAVFEETALLAQLNDRPESKPSALERAKAMLTGGTPAPRQDLDGLGFRLTECRERLALLGAAIAEQRGIMAGLVSAQSAIANIDAKQGHIKAAERIQSALAGLHDAMRAEQSIRAELAAGGYRCSLEPFERPGLNFSDYQSELGRFERDVNAYLLRCETEAKKSATVRLLIDCTAGRIGDVVTLIGREAATLVNHGHAEQTTAKPSRTPRQVIEAFGQTMANALS